MLPHAAETRSALQPGSCSLQFEFVRLHKAVSICEFCLTVLPP